MPKEYTMPFHLSSMSWSPVTIRAGLKIGSRDDAPFLQLLPSFEVKDSPNIRSGVGGLSSGILSVSNKRLTNNGTIAEFTVSVQPPKNDAERDRMIRVIGDQMGFLLQVTLHPLPAAFPGAPVSVMNTLTEQIDDTVILHLKLPPDRLTVKPEENPVLIETNQDHEVLLSAACERIDFSTLRYDVIRDAANQPLKPLLIIRSRINKASNLLRLTKEDGKETSDLRMKPVRFLVGDKSPVEVFDVTVRRPPGVEKTEPDELKIAISCLTHPLLTEFRVLKGDRDIHRETVEVHGDLLDVDVTCKEGDMDWMGTSLVYQVHDAGAFFNRSHYDTGKFSLEESRHLEIQLYKEAGPEVTRDHVSLTIEKQPFSAILVVFKTGWRPLDQDLADLMGETSDALEEKLSGAVLEVSAKAAFQGSLGQLQLETDDLIVQDLSGSLRINGQDIPGKWAEGVLCFQCPGQPVKGKKVSLNIELVPDEYLREGLEEIHEKACQLDRSLDADVRHFGSQLLSLLAENTDEAISAAIDRIYSKVDLTEQFFSHGLILKQYLDIAFDLREKAARRVFENLVGLLIEISSSVIELGIQQGSILNKDTLDPQRQLVLKTEIKKSLEIQEEAAKAGIESSMAKITDYEKRLAQFAKELETSEQIIKVMERDAANGATESLLHGIQTWRKKAGLQSLSVKQISDKISDYQKEIRRLEVQLRTRAGAMDANAAEIEEVLGQMRREIGLLYTGTREGMEEGAKGVLSYDTLADILEKASEELKNSLFRFIDGFSTRLREDSNVNPVINEPYRSRFGTDPDLGELRLPPEASKSETDLLSGTELISLVQRYEKPPSDWEESRLKKWTARDRQNRKQLENHLKVLSSRLLRIGPEIAEWGKFSEDAFQNTLDAVRQLVSLIKDYEAALSEEMPVSASGTTTWANLDNLINSLSFWIATLIRVLSGLALLTGIGAPEALMLSKMADMIDLLSASAQVAVAAHLTMPELNGIIEAVPILALMMQSANIEEGLLFDEVILKS